jgi:hypothetical protein
MKRYVKALQILCLVLSSLRACGARAGWERGRGCLIPCPGLGLTGSWPVHLIAFFGYWTEGLALAVAFAVLGLAFWSRARGRGTVCLLGYGLAALPGLPCACRPGPSRCWLRARS